MGSRTTVQVRPDLIPQLEELKRKLGAASYDEVIRRLIKERRRPTRSLFGKFRKLRRFQREDLDRID
ncbi:MAG: ribbon-helix-helix protein, CopG family [Methanobacteriota archaeon]